MSRIDPAARLRSHWCSVAAVAVLALVAAACGDDDAGRAITPDTNYPNKAAPMPPVEGQPGEADATDIAPNAVQPAEDNDKDH